MAVNDLYQVTFTWESKDGVAQNVRHYEIAQQPGADPFPEAVAAGADAAIVIHYAACVSVHAKYVATRAQRISIVDGSPLGAFGESYISTALPGNVPGDKLPGQCAGVLTLRTQLAGPRRRGRFYTSFPSESHSDADGLPTPAYVALLTTLGARLVEQITASAMGGAAILRPVIYSAAGAVTTPLIGTTSRLVFGSQRRRRHGFGI